MLYLIDANILITANNNYYPVDAVPEYWAWLEFMATRGDLKMPIEVFDEIKEGPNQPGKDLLYAWIQQDHIKDNLILGEDVDESKLQFVVNEGYAPDLTDDEIEQMGRDPFLISYAVGHPDRCVITAEQSKPSKIRQNRKVPDVCKTLGVIWYGPFDLNRMLGFRTNWNA